MIEGNRHKRNIDGMHGRRAVSFDRVGKNKRSPREKKYWPYFMVVIVFIFGFSFYLFYPKLSYIIKSGKELSALVGEARYLKNRQEGLKEDIDSLNTDRGIEGVLREDLLMTKPGEEVYVILDEEKGENGKKDANKNIWDKIKSLFGL